MLWTMGLTLGVITNGTSARPTPASMAGSARRGGERTSVSVGMVTGERTAHKVLSCIEYLQFDVISLISLSITLIT